MSRKQPVLETNFCMWSSMDKSTVDSTGPRGNLTGPIIYNLLKKIKNKMFFLLKCVN